MTAPHYRGSRFEVSDDEPMGPLANLADIMLVFAVGLMVALAASGDGFEHMTDGGAEVEQGREIADVPEGVGEAGSGYQSVGQVYRDPETGRMILIGGEE